MYIKIPLKKNSETFCMALWTHAHLLPNGNRKICCTANLNNEDIENFNIGKKNFIPLEEYWNSEYMMNIRKKMLNGDEIDDCAVCNKKILQNNVKRDFFNNLFSSKIEEALAKTNEDGYTNMKPISYDYRIDNLCNFKCRMCTPLFSSSIERENKKHGLYEKIQNVKIENEKIKLDIKNELLNAIQNKTIEDIYWAGGEPLISNFHWEAMCNLIENKHASNVTVKYHTNLSKINYKEHNLYDILINFKDVKIYASIDGTDDIVEYIRDGIKWKKWLFNLKKLLPLNKKFNHAVSLDITVTSFGLFSIKNLIDLSIKYDLSTNIKCVLAFDDFIVLSPLMIPNEILHPIIDDIIIYAKQKFLISQKAKPYIDFFENLKIKSTLDTVYPDYLEKINKSKNKLFLLDNHRGSDGKLDKIFIKNKKLYDWWIKI